MLDAPLLFESKILEWFCYPIVVVSISDKNKQRDRLIARNKELSKNQADSKINSQMPNAIKVAKADIVVQNNGTQKELTELVTRQTIPKILKDLKLDMSQ